MLFALLFFLLAAHALTDYALQNETIATCKGRHCDNLIAKSLPWYYWLTAHALIHGGAVYWATGSLSLGLLETVVHWLIDFGKCEGWFGIHVDQALHVGCKIVWCLLIANGVPATWDAYLATIPRPTT